MTTLRANKRKETCNQRKVLTDSQEDQVLEKPLLFFPHAI